MTYRMYFTIMQKHIEITLHTTLSYKSFYWDISRYQLKSITLFYHWGHLNWLIFADNHTIYQFVIVCYRTLILSDHVERQYVSHMCNSVYYHSKILLWLGWSGIYPTNAGDTGHIELVWTDSNLKQPHLQLYQWNIQSCLVLDQ